MNQSKAKQLLDLRTFITRVFGLATIIIGVFLFFQSQSVQTKHLERNEISQYRQIQHLLLLSVEDAIIAEDLTILSNIVQDLGQSDSNIALIEIRNDENNIISEWRTPRAADEGVVVLAREVVMVAGKAQGSIQFIIDLSHEKTLISAYVLENSLIVSLMLMILLVVQLFIVNRIVVRPIEKIEERLIGIEKGDLGSDFQVGGSKEFSQLAQSLNRVSSTLALRIAAEMRSREELEILNNAYIRFVPKAFLEMLGQSSITKVNLGDHTRTNLTVMFTDIRSFTPLAESLSEKKTFEFINEYFACLGPVVRQHNGVIDKYIGDAIMALFKNPDDAVLAGLAMVDVLKEFNHKRGGKPIEMGIGLHTGEVMLGTIGEQYRMEGTVIGDVVNLAARLEDLTKKYDASFLISNETKEATLPSDRYTFTFVDEVLAKGKTIPTQVFSVRRSE